jgi:hypothetical protein
MGERARGGAPARGRHRRCRSLGDRIARAAGIFRPNVANDLEVPRHIIQHLGHVLAEPGHSLAACRAGTRAIVLRLMHDIVSRQMIGQRLALGPGTFADRCRLILGFSAGEVFSLAALQFLEPEFELLDLAADPLRRPAKLHSPQPATARTPSNPSRCPSASAFAQSCLSPSGRCAPRDPPRRIRAADRPNHQKFAPQHYAGSRPKAGRGGAFALRYVP